MTDPYILAGRYQVLGVLGRGGMGEVFLAHDLRLDIDVAIKCLPRDYAGDPLLKSALIKESRILARLNDPHIVRFFDLADTPDGLLMVMEYVCGPSLQQVIRARGRLTETELAHIMRDVSAGMQAAHVEGVVHRDLKPANLLLSLAPVERAAFLSNRVLPSDVLDMQAKVADFGIAKLLATSATVTTTATIFSTAGSPAYMAPEQVRGETPSPETDVYAMGIIAYEVLAGRPPFTSGDLAHQHLNVAPPPIGGCSPRIEAAVARALAKRREDRYPSAAAFLEALAGDGRPGASWAGQQSGIGLADPVERAVRPMRWRLSYRVIVPLLLAIVMGLVIWRGRRGDRGGEAFGDPGAGISAPSTSAQSSLASINPAPYVSELPPVVEEARNPQVAEPWAIAGPRHLKIAWTARVLIPETESLLVAGTGPEGTVYFLGVTRQGGGMICAMKDRKLLWGFSHVTYVRFTTDDDFDIAPDGRVWIGPASPDDPHFCFNSLGQGGSLPKLVKPWARTRTRLVNSLKSDYAFGLRGGGYACSPDAERNLKSDRPALIGRPWDGGKAWSLPLDQPCIGLDEDALPVGPTGEGYFQTIDKVVYRVSPQGQVRWRYGAACMARPLYPLPSGDLLFFCGQDFYRVHDGGLQWKFSWTSDYSQFLLIDRAETVYAMANDRGQHTNHVVAIASNGQQLWDVALQHWQPQGLFLAANGRLYITGEINDGSGAWGIACLAE